MAAILFVTGETLIPRMLTVLLAHDGINAHHARTADEAIRMLAEHADIGAVCADVVLAGETGIELYDRVRGELQKPELPFFFVTALNVTSELGRRLRRDMHCHHFQRPIDPDEMLPILREVLAHG